MDADSDMRFAAITPPSQNQCLYDRASYFHAFFQAIEVKAMVAGASVMLSLLAAASSVR